MKLPGKRTALAAEFRLSPEDRVPVRAALSASIALLISHAFPTQRWYWAVLVSVILVSGSFGEGTQKGLARFTMTAFGCVVAWLLSHLVGGYQAARVCVMLVSIFLSVYFRALSYAWFTFFITVYVVFLFAVFGAPTAQITVFRVFETFVGCGVALASSLIVPMPFARRQWEDEAAEFFRACRDQAARSFEVLLGPAGPADSGGGAAAAGAPPAADAGPGAVPRQLSVLASRHAASMFETFFSPGGQRHRDRVMARARRLAQAVLALDLVARVPVRPVAVAGVRGELAAVRDDTLARLESARAAERTAWAVGERPAVTGAGAGGSGDSSEALQLSPLCAALTAARDGGDLTAEEFLVLEAVEQYASEVGRLVSEAVFEGAEGLSGLPRRASRAAGLAAVESAPR